MERIPIRGDESPDHSKFHREKEMEDIYQREITEGANIIKKEVSLKSSEGAIVDYLKDTATVELQGLRDLDPDKGTNLNVLISYVAESCAEIMYGFGRGKPPILTRISKDLLLAKDEIFDEMQRLYWIKTPLDTTNFKETIAEARLEGLRLVRSGDDGALDMAKYLFAQELVRMSLFNGREVLPQLKLLFSVEEIEEIIDSVDEEMEETERDDGLADNGEDDIAGVVANDDTCDKSELLRHTGVHKRMADRIMSVKEEKNRKRSAHAREASIKSVDNEWEYMIALIKKYSDIRDFVDDVLDTENMPI